MEQTNVRPSLSEHAAIRCQQRCIKEREVHEAIKYGRCIRAKGALFFVVGKKEVQKQSQLGRNIQRLKNLQVLISKDFSRIITVYRNSNFRQIKQC